MCGSSVGGDSGGGTPSCGAVADEGDCSLMLGSPSQHLAGYCSLELLIALAWSHLPRAWGHPLLNFSCMRKCLVEAQLVEGELQ